MIVHLNGRLMPLDEARISPLDRGFLFGDGVYEGLRSVPRGGSARVIGLGHHVRRMQAGLNEAGIGWDAAGIGPASIDLLRANHLQEGFIYWQVTRGTPPPGDPPRSRVPAPHTAMRPTVFAYCSPQPAIAGVTEPPTKRAAVCRDVRWERGHLKSISLMGNVLTAIDAAAQGLDEAIMVRARDGVDLVSEGLATNVVLALPGRGGGVDIVTPSLTSVSILAGVTRSILLQECPEIIERPVLASELATAREVMLIGTTTLVTSVVALDGRMIGDGRPGPVARRLLDILFAAIAAGRDDPEQPGGPPTIVHELRQPA